MGVLDWPVPPMPIIYEPERRRHANLGGVKQLHEYLAPNTEEECNISRDLVAQHAEEACDSINLGRFSKQMMPHDVMLNLICIMSETAPPHALLRREPKFGKSQSRW